MATRLSEQLVTMLTSRRMQLNKDLFKIVRTRQHRSASTSSLDHGAAESDRNIVARSEEFYEEHAAKRHYFYVMDLRGQLFVENIVRNIATSMKDVKFLDFMYKNLQYNKTGLYPDIPLVTYCGREMNFVTPIDSLSVFVYKDLLRPSGNESVYQLQYGGSLTHTFDPSKLAFCHKTGRVYHEIVSHKHLTEQGRQLYGLLNVTITTHFFSDKLVFDSEDKLKLRWEYNGIDIHDVKLI
jgi:hypothetical protein